MRGSIYDQRSNVQDEVRDLKARRNGVWGIWCLDYGEIMSSSVLVWKDSKREVRKERIHLYISIIGIQFMLLFVLYIYFVTGSLLFLILFVVVLLLDIYYLRTTENIYPLMIYTDKIFYTEIGDASLHGISSAHTRIIRYDEIEEIEDMKAFNSGVVGELLFSVGGKEVVLKNFHIILKNGQRITLDNHYISDIDSAYFHLKNQFKHYYNIHK